MRQTVKIQIARLLVVVLVGILLSAYIPASVSAAESGSCGQSLNWHFAAGTLTISGEGEMYDYYDGKPAPWYHLADQIIKVVLPEGLTVIGRQAFYNCTALTAVSMPNTVRTIHPKAFYNCEKLRYVVFSNKLSLIEEAAFFGCRQLSALTLPATVEEIGSKAFYLCEGLLSVTIPQSTTKWGEEIFAYCTSLLRVKILSPISAIPAWTFYGCSSLSDIEMPDTLSQVDEYAFRKCLVLSGVYYNGEKISAHTIRKEITEDLPEFSSAGYVGAGVIPDNTFHSQIVIDENDNVVSQTNTNMYVSDEMVLTSAVTLRPATETTEGSYSATLSLVVDGNTAWEEAKSKVDMALRQVNDSYSAYGTEQTAKLTIYVSDGSDVDEGFVKSLTGRKVETEIVTAEGSAWSLDCERLKESEVSGSLNYTYQVDEMGEETLKNLGSTDGYLVSFHESTQIKSQIQVQLPATTAGKNAFLYQVEDDGSYTRLQAVEVDSKGTAHFYLASVDQNTNYLIGMNVPGERTDDVIASPDRATQNAIVRLEQIQYVETGARTLHGMTLSRMMLIVGGVLLVTGIVVGIIMVMYNKSKLKRYQYTQE